MTRLSLSPAAPPMIQSNRMRFIFGQLVLMVLFLCVAMPALADSGFQKNVELLRGAEDFRVRTQAALALGASGQKAAVTPLCHALADENRTVRIASATAISRIRKGGEACLKRRLSSEKDPRVLSSIKKALERLGAGSSAEPAIGSETRIFVALEKVAGPARLEEPVRAAFVKGAKGRRDVAFAEAGQSVSQAEKVLAKYPAAKGFKLAPKLSRPRYEEGALRVKMSVAILSYPQAALLGSFSKSLGISGVQEPDTEAENELVVMAAEEAMKQFLQIAPSLDL